MTINTLKLESLGLKSKYSWRYKRSCFTDTLLILDSVVTGLFGIKQKELHLKAPSPPSTGKNSAICVLIFLHKWLTTASKWFCPTWTVQFVQHDITVWDSPGHRSDWPAGPSHLHPPELCNNPETEISVESQTPHEELIRADPVTDHLLANLKHTPF